MIACPTLKKAELVSKYDNTTSDGFLKFRKLHPIYFFSKKHCLVNIENNSNLADDFFLLLQRLTSYQFVYASCLQFL